MLNLEIRLSLSSEGRGLCARPSGRGDFSHEDGWSFAPPIFSFYSRIKRENGPCTVQKRKTSNAPAGGRGTGARLNVPPFFGEGLWAAAQCGRGGWWSSNRLSPLSAAADAPVIESVGAAEGGGLFLRNSLSLLRPPYKIIYAYPKMVRQFPYIFQVRQTRASFIFLVMLFGNSQGFRYLYLCFTLFFPKFTNPLFENDFHSAPLTNQKVCAIL